MWFERPSIAVYGPNLFWPVTPFLSVTIYLCLLNVCDPNSIFLHLLPHKLFLPNQHLLVISMSQ